MMAHNQISDTWERGDPYEQYIGRWSRKMAPAFLSWLSCKGGLRWLDVGCGTGALCAAIIDNCAPALAAGVEPSEGFRKTASANLAGQAVVYEGSATAIPFEPSSFDVVVSGLVLNFVADQTAAVMEMARVTRDGGTIGAYIWDYAGKMELIRLFWETAAALDPVASSLDEGRRFPLCSPRALQKLFVRPGLTNISVAAIDIQTPFANFDDYWKPFLGGQGPAPAYVLALDERTRAQLRDRLRDSIAARPDGPFSLIARAWAVRATVATPH